MRRLIVRMGAMIAAAILAGGIVLPREARAADPPTLAFQHVAINSSGDAPEACFHFTEALDRRAEAHYGDYVAVVPAMTPALRVAGNELCLGGLGYGTDYKVTLRRGLPAESGARLAADETVDVTLGDRIPLVALSGDGFILPRAKGKGIAVETVNVASVRIHVLRMSDRLLPSQLRAVNPYVVGGALSNQEINRFALRNLLRGTLGVVWTGTMAIAQDHNRTIETAFPLTNVIKPGQRGAYLVIAEDASHPTADKFFNPTAADDNHYDQDDFKPLAAHWVISTDIALTAVSSTDGLHVFARSLATATPLGEIKLALTAAGQDVLGEASTDTDGHARFAPGLMRGTGANAPASVVAHGPQGDFTLINLNRPAFDFSDRGVSGRRSPGDIDAFLYTDRGIYRPGQTVEAMTLLRNHSGEAIANMKLTLTLRRPDGVEAQHMALDPAPEGGFHSAIPLSRTASRGQWTLEARVDPSGEPVGRVQFDVEDFVPQQLKVTVTAATPFLRAGQKLAATVDGEYLYGAPAAGLTGEAELRITRDPAPVASAKDYSFGLIDEKVDDAVQKFTLPAADDKGHAEIDGMLDARLPPTAPVKGILSAGLFDPAGRIVKDEIALPIRSQPLLIGIKPRFAEDRAPEGKNALFDIRAFDEQGQPVAHMGLRWRLVREERVYDWFATRADNWTWHYHVVDHDAGGGTIDVGANAPAVLSEPVEWGFYRLVVDDPVTHAGTSVRFRAGWFQTADAADTPDKVDITLDKPSYAPGDTARVRVAPPFAGLAQLTIAGDRVFETRAVSVPKGGATFAIKVAADWGPGAYAVLSLYRPLDQGRARDPVRAVGVAWLALDAKPRTLAVKMTLPDKVLPRRHLSVPVDIVGARPGEPTYVTVAAIDEGILQLTRFQSPDPAGYFFGKRRLGIDFRDDYGRLLDESAKVGSIREGGDKAIGGETLPVVSTRTVALFTGPVKVGANGRATVDLDIPDFEGQLRLMAVAYNARAVGRGEAKLIVRDPVIADVAMPRFLAPGDTARLAVELHNTDGAAGQYRLALASSGAAKLTADHPLQYALAAGGVKRDSVTLEGEDEGVAVVTADLTGPDGYAVHREWQVAVRAAHYPITIADTALQPKSGSYRIDAEKLRPFVPGSVTVSIGYSGFAGIDVPSLLQSLYRYPFGCTEQMASIAFPLIYDNDPALLAALPRDQGIGDRVQSAIDSILDREDAAGRFGLWRVGDDEASPWLNVYALDFLIHAKEAGFRVPDGAIERSLGWVQLAVRQPNLDRGVYANTTQATQAYAAYVLARSGRADLGELRRIHDALRWQHQGDGAIVPASVGWGGGTGPNFRADAVSLAHLAGALLLMGDHARAKDTFDLAVSDLAAPTTSVAYPIAWFNSFYATPTRDLAALIAVAAEAGDTDLAESLAPRLANAPIDTSRLNTQEQAWLLMAAHALNKQGTAQLAVNGQDRGALSLPVALAPSVADIVAGYEIANTGTRDLWHTVVIRGSPTVAPSAMDAGFTLSKAYLSVDGKPVDPAQLKQNDRLIVSLSGQAADLEGHRAVLVDLLPAGWEIEAPIVRDTDYAFLGPLTRAGTEEARDDRFVAAFDLGNVLAPQRRFVVREQNDAQNALDANAFHVAYLVRVVTPGRFTLPEAVIEDMYRPGVMARTEAGSTEAEAR